LDALSTNTVDALSNRVSRRFSSAANAHAGAPIAARAIGWPHDRSAAVVAIAVAVATMNTHCAARTDASRPVGTGRARGGVGFGDLNGEQTQNHQAGSDYLHHQRVSFAFDFVLTSAP